MKTTLRALTALVVVFVGVLLGAQPAAAGGWAVTLLDPMPDRVEAGRPYTVGFWVLQHGSHPFYGGKLDPVGLKLVDAKGQATVFAGTALPEPAHYVTTVTVPAAGTFTLYGVQGPFADYRIGTLTVPGTLAVLPMPPPMPVSADQQPWGAVRPPSIPVDPAREPYAENGPDAAPAAAPATSAETAPAAAPASRRTAGERTVTLWTTLAVLLAGTAVLLALGRRHRWSWAGVRRRWDGGDEPRRQLIG